MGLAQSKYLKVIIEMKIRHLFFLFLLIFIFSFFTLKVAFANSDYVLPYPSFMPGNKFYTVSKVFEKLEKYWYFGNFAQFKYNLKLSDKYLVEAKTLFEYKQYLFAVKALKDSDMYFKNTSIYLKKAKKEEKDITEKNKILISASQKHKEILQEIEKNIPDNFNWQPEKLDSTYLDFKKIINNSIAIRSKGI
jgi:hypothetical protein